MYILITGIKEHRRVHKGRTLSTAKKNTNHRIVTKPEKIDKRTRNCDKVTLLDRNNMMINCFSQQSLSFADCSTYVP